MILKYHQAVVSFCSDLTSPTAGSVPVAVLLVGSFDKFYCASIGALVPVQGDIDPFTKEFLQDIPSLLRRQLDESLSRLPRGYEIEQLLEELRHALRNSLHVSEIVEPREAEFATNAELRGLLQRVPFETLDQALEDSGIELVQMAAPEPGRLTPPASQMWPLQPVGV